MSIDEVNKICKNTLISHLGIEFLAYGENYVSAKMPVNSNVLQPMGILHGGASLALAETVASVGSYLLVDPAKYSVRGLQVNGNHVSAVSDGEVFARAEIIHKGRMTHVWDVTILSEKQIPVSFVRVTIIIVESEKIIN